MKNWYIVQSHSSFENKVASLIKEEAEKAKIEMAFFQTLRQTDPLLAKAQGDYVTITESRNLNINVDLSAYTEEELKTMLMYMEKDNSSIIDTK